MAKAKLPAAKADSKTIAREIWKPVPSEPGVLASSWGRVLLPPCYAPNNGAGFRLVTPKPRWGQKVKASKTAKHEYLNVMLRNWGAGPRQRPRKVHQLVCEAFHGERPSPDAVVIHKDEDSLNNRPENLRWGTQKENLNAPGFIAYCQGRTGEDHPHYKGRGKTAGRSLRLIEFDGERIALSDACRRTGVKYATALSRLKSGWPPDQVLRPRTMAA